MQTVGTFRGRPDMMRMARFWGQIYVINYALGIATGLVMEFQFGLSWSGLSHYAGTSSARRWRSRRSAPSSWSPRSSACGSSAGTGCHRGSTWRASGSSH
nr:hypothetical protein GCM10020093_004060 [Planobispora longispora]